MAEAAEPLDLDAPELAVINDLGRLGIEDCTPEEVRLARLIHEPWCDETLEQAMPSDRSIVLKQARMALAYAQTTNTRLVMGPGRYRNDLGAELTVIGLYGLREGLCIGGVWAAWTDNGVLGKRSYLVTREGLEQAGYKRVEETCSYCGGNYPAPIELHHSESECAEATGAPMT